MDTNKLLSDDLSPLKIRYKQDNDVIFDNNYFETIQGYNVITNKIFKNLRSQKTNNYSNFYLTDKNKLSDILELHKLDNYNFNIVSYIMINELYLSANLDLLYFNDTPNTKFEIVFEDNRCYLKTYNSDSKTYLFVTYNIENNVAKLTTTDDFNDKFLFDYVINNKNELFLLMSKDNNISRTLIVTYDDNQLIGKQQDSSKYFSDDQTFKIKIISNTDVNINTAWATYNDKVLNINKFKSYYNLSNNILASSVYTYSDSENLDLDLLILKNQISHKGFVNEGDSLRNIDYREYTDLFTGSNQETGNNFISLNYNYITTDLKIKSGKNIFTTPESLYPYKQLDLNDSKFINNGSFGSDKPTLSDKFYKINNNDLLQSYSWLSCSSVDDCGVWVNRYYNPMLFNYQNVNTQPVNILYNNTNVDELIYKNPNLINEGYFDVVSNLIIEPSTTYVYNRITNNEIINYIDNNPHLVINGLNLLDYNGSQIYNNDTENYIYDFTGKEYAYVNLKTNVPYNQFCISFYMNGDNWDNIIADQIMGNYNCNGFAFKRNTIITPFPMITFSLGSFFGATDIWNNITKNVFGDVSYWNRYNSYWNTYSDDAIAAVRGQYLFNTNFEVVDILPIIDSLVKTVRINHLDYYYNIYETQLVKMTPVGVETVSLPIDLENNEKILNVSYDENNIYSISNTNKMYEYNYNDGTIITHPTTSLSGDNLLELDSNYHNAVAKSNDKYYFVHTENNILENHDDLGIFYCHNEESELTNLSSYGDQPYNVQCILRYKPNNDDIMYNYDVHDNSTRFFEASSIQDFKIIDDTICVLYNRTKFALYDYDRTLLYSHDFALDNQNVKFVDYVNEITPNGYESYYIIIVFDKVFDSYNKEILSPDDDPAEEWSNTDYISIYKYDLKNNQLSLLKKLNYSQNLIGNKTDNKITQYSLIQKQNKNREKFYIQYKLLNKYNNSSETRVVNLPDFNPGKNHIAINFDSINGKLQIYINGKLKVEDVFDAGKYVFENIFEDIFLIGNLSYYSVPLFKQLKQQNYFAKNFNIEQFKVFDNILDKNTIKALSLYNTPIEDIVLNIPCDNRNKIETIERYFKESVPGFCTNKIDINIKNLTISENDRLKLSNIIRLHLRSKLANYLDINNINYKFTI